LEAGRLARHRGVLHSAHPSSQQRGGRLTLNGIDGGVVLHNLTTGQLHIIDSRSTLRSLFLVYDLPLSLDQHPWRRFQLIPHSRGLRRSPTLRPLPPGQPGQPGIPLRSLASRVGREPNHSTKILEGNQERLVPPQLLFERLQPPELGFLVANTPATSPSRQFYIRPRLRNVIRLNIDQNARLAILVPVCRFSF